MASFISPSTVSISNLDFPTSLVRKAVFYNGTLWIKIGGLHDCLVASI